MITTEDILTVFGRVFAETHIADKLSADGHQKLANSFKEFGQALSRLYAVGREHVKEPDADFLGARMFELFMKPYHDSGSKLPPEKWFDSGTDREKSEKIAPAIADIQNFFEHYYGAWKPEVLAGLPSGEPWQG